MAKQNIFFFASKSLSHVQPCSPLRMSKKEASNAACLTSLCYPDDKVVQWQKSPSVFSWAQLESWSVTVPPSDSEDVTGAELCHCVSSNNKNSPDKLKEHGFSLQQVGTVWATLSLCWGSGCSQRLEEMVHDLMMLSKRCSQETKMLRTSQVEVKLAGWVKEAWGSDNGREWRERCDASRKTLCHASGSFSAQSCGTKDDSLGKSPLPKTHKAMRGSEPPDLGGSAEALVFQLRIWPPSLCIRWIQLSCAVAKEWIHFKKKKQHKGVIHKDKNAANEPHW